MEGKNTAFFEKIGKIRKNSKKSTFESEKTTLEFGFLVDLEPKLEIFFKKIANFKQNSNFFRFFCDFSKLCLRKQLFTKMGNFYKNWQFVIAFKKAPKNSAFYECLRVYYRSKSVCVSDLDCPLVRIATRKVGAVGIDICGVTVRWGGVISENWFLDEEVR